MELILYRSYFPQGTNGKLFWGKLHLCNTIELPFVNNRRNVSCIPEGRYRISKRLDPKHGLQLEICNVPSREAILIHPANDALLELRGCVAPVRSNTAPGKGLYSRLACKKVEALVLGAIEKGEAVWLRIRVGVVGVRSQDSRV